MWKDKNVFLERITADNTYQSKNHWAVPSAMVLKCILLADIAPLLSSWDHLQQDF